MNPKPRTKSTTRAINTVGNGTPWNSHQANTGSSGFFYGARCLEPDARLFLDPDEKQTSKLAKSFPEFSTSNHTSLPPLPSLDLWTLSLYGVRHNSKVSIKLAGPFNTVGKQLRDYISWFWRSKWTFPRVRSRARTYFYRHCETQD